VGPTNSVASGSMDTEEPTTVMKRKPLPHVDDERTLVDIAPTTGNAGSTLQITVAPPPPPPVARPASAPAWKGAPAKPPRPTPSAPRPRTSGPPPLPPSVAATAKRAVVPPLPPAARLPRASVTPSHPRMTG
jgi:hypothetical protein